MTRSSNGERDAQGQTSIASSSIATRRSRRRTSSERDVGEQVPAGGALVVGGEALALARDLDRDEGQRVELRVGVLERGAGVGALVDDQVQVGGARRWARMRSRHAATAPAKRSSLSSVSDWTCSGALTITSWWPDRGPAREEVGLALARRRAQRVGGAREALRVVGLEVAVRRRARGRGWGRRAPSSRGCPARRRRGAPPRPRAACGPRGPRRTGTCASPFGLGDPAAVEGVGAVGAARREDRPQAGELVDADLGRARHEPGEIGLRIWMCSMPSSMKRLPSGA